MVGNDDTWNGKRTTFVGLRLNKWGPNYAHKKNINI